MANAANAVLYATGLDKAAFANVLKVVSTSTEIRAKVVHIRQGTGCFPRKTDFFKKY